MVGITRPMRDIGGDVIVDIPTDAQECAYAYLALGM